jgi:hypothetical protein
MHGRSSCWMTGSRLFLSDKHSQGRRPVAGDPPSPLGPRDMEYPHLCREIGRKSLGSGRED